MKCFECARRKIALRVAQSDFELAARRQARRPTSRGMEQVMAARTIRDRQRAALASHQGESGHH